MCLCLSKNIGGKDTADIFNTIPTYKHKISTEADFDPIKRDKKFGGDLWPIGATDDNNRSY